MGSTSYPYYQVVRLVDYKPAPEDLVVIPTGWIKTSNNFTEFVIQCMEPSDNPEDLIIAEDFVSKRIEPLPESWPTYTCLSQCEANTFKEAKLKLSSMKLSYKKVQQKKQDSKGKANNKPLIDEEMKMYSISKEKFQSELRDVPPMQEILSNDLISNSGKDASAKPFLTENGDSKNSPRCVSRDECNRVQDSVQSINPLSDVSNLSEPKNDNTLQALKKKYNQLAKKLDVLLNMVQALTQSLDELKMFVMDKRSLQENTEIITLSQLCSMQSLTLPFQTIEEINTYNEKLKSDDNFKIVLKKYFFTTMNSTLDIKKSVRQAFRNFFSKELALLITAQKPMKNKIVFNSTEYGQVMKECTLHVYASKNVTEMDFLHTVGSVLNNVKDWNKRDRPSTDGET